MSARTALAAAVALAALAWTARASAQDMVFTTEGEEGGGDMTFSDQPAEGPPSEAMAAGLKLYQQKAFREASVQFQRVVEGATTDAEANQMKAQFFLGKSLFHLKFYQSSLAVFEEVVQSGERHLYFRPTLEWLAQLSRVLPEPAGIIGLTGQYGDTPAVLADFNTPERAETYNELLYMMGRYWYNQAEFAKARTFLESVDPEAKHFVHSLFFVGITYVRERKASASVGAFKKIVDKYEGTPRIFLSAEEERFLDLAWLSLARMYYTLEHWDSALESWSHVPQTSEYWLDALFEESWAYFMVGEDTKIQGNQKALGNIHTLNSPYFDKTSFYPESLVLKSVIYFGNCWYEEANETVEYFVTEYQPIHQELQVELQKYEDNISFFEFLRKLKSEQGMGLSDQLTRILNTALNDRTLLRNLEYVKVLEKEEERLGKMPPEFRNASIGIRILQDIAAAKSVAIDNAGDLARNRYERLLAELQDLLNQAAAIQIEIINAMLGELDKELQDQQVLVATKASKKIKTDSEHQLWPFDTEYWRDELGSYRQLIDSRCGR